MQIAKIVTIVKIPFATAETGKNKMTGNHALILRNDFQNDKSTSLPGLQGLEYGSGRENFKTRTGPDQDQQRLTVRWFLISPTSWSSDSFRKSMIVLDYDRLWPWMRFKSMHLGLLGEISRCSSGLSLWGKPSWPQMNLIDLNWPFLRDPTWLSGKLSEWMSMW